MKKIGLGILISLFVMVMAGMVIAQGPGNRQPAEVVPSGQIVEVPAQVIDSSPVLLERFITPTVSAWSKFGYQLMGCQVIHELSDATALKCPTQTAALLNLREDRIFHITDLEADQQIGADQVWAQGIDGTGINVAVLDTGIDTDHPELSDSIVDCQSFVEGIATCEDDNGHGTHVSGIITANGVDSLAKGVAPGAGIYMYKVCDATGSCYESDIMAAMEAAVLTNAKVMNIRVMNISLGGGNFSGENCDTDDLAVKTNWVVSQGITVAAAAGNDRFYVSSPACASGAIAVGAVDKNDLMAYFSNFGPSLDIVAPGVSIYSSIIDGYASWSGTSMSAPHLAGTVALVLDANPSLNIDEIKTALYSTADDINPNSVCYGVVRQRGAAVWIGVVPCSSNNYGAGIVDAYGAVNAITPAEPVCGDNIINQSTEECDGIDLAGQTCENLGFDYGTLTCTPTCTFNTSDCNDAVCGNNLTEPTEVCDGTDLVEETCQTQGFDAGSLICNSDCLGFDTSECYNYICGNGIIEGAEECDSTNLGDATCEGLGFDSGTLTCTANCTFDTSDCITTEPVCGDGYCAGADLGEDCRTCSEDCIGYSRGRPSGRYCCGNYICELVRENPENCPIDCQ